MITRKMKLLTTFFILAFTLLQSLHAQDNTINQSYHPDFKAIYWYQQSAEMRALYYQGYHLATLRLQDIAKVASTKKRAVVLDLDETVMDNSPYQAFSIVNNVQYPTGWTEWINLASAKDLPGAKAFLIKAKEMGIEPIYITNRKDSEKQKTIENLKKLGLPNAEEAFVLTRSNENDKTERRALVSQNFDIVLLIGDNLGDFDELFQGKTNFERNRLVDQFNAEFADKFIILPNPMYGEWESAGVDFDFSKPLFKRYNQMKDSLDPARL